VDKKKAKEGGKKETEEKDAEPSIFPRRFTRFGEPDAASGVC
jgi:hypothetical protein